MFVTNCHAMPCQTGRSVDAAVRRAVGILLVAGGTSLVALSVLAQTSSPPSDVAPSERAKRDADKVFHWILIQGDRTRKAPAAAAKDAKEAKDAKDAKEERPAAKPARVAAPDVVPVRTKPDATVGTADPAVALTQPAAKPSGKPAAKRAEASAPLAAPPNVADAPGSEGARLARAEAAPQAKVPPVEASDDAPQGLVALAQPAPQFPINVMRTLRRGTVQVRFNVLTDGNVANLEVLNTTNARLNAAALEAIGQWRFQPLSKMQTGAVEVGFNLD